MIETLDSNKPKMAKEYFVDRAIDEAASVPERIEKWWPEETVRER
jgi:hypothetical protein